jgi:hypothetical protein
LGMTGDNSTFSGGNKGKVSPRGIDVVFFGLLEAVTQPPSKEMPSTRKRIANACFKISCFYTSQFHLKPSVREIQTKR